MNPEVSLSLEEMFLKNNKVLKLLFKLIKRNLLCTLLYKKMHIMQGCVLGKTILAWSFQFISSPLGDTREYSGSGGSLSHVLGSASEVHLLA